MKERLQQAYRQTKHAMKSSRQRQKNNYDLKAQAATLKKGDRVLLRIVAYEGKHEIADNPYVILSQVNHDIPVYKIMREDGESRCKCRVLHRNHLLP